MKITIDSDTMLACFLVFFILLFLFLIISLILLQIVKNSDNGKQLITCNVKILEKTSNTASIAWYVVEDENRNRFKLRNLKADKLIISVGDVGLISYRGQTIESFVRK